MSRRTRVALPAVVLALSVLSVPVSTAAAASVGPTAVAAKKGPSLTVSKTTGLPASGATVTVKGKGFDMTKGIYVAFCVVPAPGQVPTPCGGGMTTTGAGNLSHWISSNPPPYGVDLAEPFGRGGTFTVKLRVSPTIGTGDAAVNCLIPKKCAVVARADHTHITDRGQDVIIPVTFKAAQ